MVNKTAVSKKIKVNPRIGESRADKVFDAVNILIMVLQIGRAHV